MKITFKCNQFNIEQIAAAFFLPIENVEKSGDYFSIKILEQNEYVKTDAYYKLQKKESEHTLSRKFNIPISVIKRANQGIKITQGVTVFIPNFTGKKYVVKPLDSFESVCKMFNVKKEELIEKNGVDYLYAGMVLEI